MTNMNTLKIIEGQAEQAHLEWLKEAKIADINKIKLTVLPYGFLSRAVKKSCQQSIIQILEAEVERKRGIIKPIEEPEEQEGVYRGFKIMQNKIDESYNKALEEDITHLTDIINKLK